MFEQETKLIITTAMQRTIANQPAIAIRDIMAADIPYMLKTFFRADVESILAEELQRYHTSSRFNFNHPEAQSLQSQVNSVLILHFSFDRPEFLRRLDDTVHLLINYLVRPQWTLINVLFEKESSVSASRLMLMLKHFGPYEYLKDIIVRYMHDKNIPSFTRDEFASFLWKVDGEYVRRKTGDEMARIISPLFEFLDYPNNSGNKTMPVKALIKYFEDKGMITVLQRLEGEIAQGNNELGRHDLGELLEDVRRTSGAFEVEKKIDTPSAELQQMTVSMGNTIPMPEETMTTQAIRISAPRVLQQSPARPQAQRPVRTISIEENARRRFIKKIFLQDETAFQEALVTMGSLADWKEASKQIDEIFIQNNIDPYCAEAEEFLELLYRHFYRVQ